MDTSKNLSCVHQQMFENWPRLRAGKNVRAPTIRMVETSKPANSPPVTGNVPADSGTGFFFAGSRQWRAPGIIMKKATEELRGRCGRVVPHGVALIPANAEPLFPVDETYALKHLRQSVWPGVGYARSSVWLNYRDGREDQDRAGQYQDREHGHLDVVDSIFLPNTQAFCQTIRPAMNTARTTKMKIP